MQAPIQLPLDVLESSRDVIFVLDREDRITYCNPAWDLFAQANSGENVVRERVIGTHYWSHIPDDLQPFYRMLLEASRQGHVATTFLYECSSQAIFRQFHMQAWPVDERLVISNSLAVEQAHTREASRGMDRVYRNEHGVAVMCCHCRRTRRLLQPGDWDWVPDYLHKLTPKISHSLCPLCRAYFYPEWQARDLLPQARSMSGPC